MPSWRPFTLNMIPGVPQALDAVGQATSTLTGLLDTLAGLLETLAQLAQFMADAMQAAMAALCALIQEIIDQIFNLLNTGIYFYLDKGPFFTGAQPDGLEVSSPAGAPPSTTWATTSGHSSPGTPRSPPCCSWSARTTCRVCRGSWRSWTCSSDGPI